MTTYKITYTKTIEIEADDEDQAVKKSEIELIFAWSSTRSLHNVFESTIERCD